MDTPQINMHCFRKMKQAETNMMRLLRRRGLFHYRTKYWARAFMRWAERTVEKES